MEKVVDKLSNIQLIFREIISHLALQDVKLHVYDDTSDEHLGPIFVSSYVNPESRWLEHIVTIRNGVIDYGPYYHTIDHRLFSFIRWNGVEVDAVSRTVIMILHELGHVNRANTMYAYNLEVTAKLIDDVSKRILEDFTTTKIVSQTIQGEGIDLNYMLRSDEMYADCFAMKYFTPVMNHLKERGLI